jgi:hypothetical protein
MAASVFEVLMVVTISKRDQTQPPYESMGYD